MLSAAPVQVLEVVTAIVAAVEATKLNGLVAWLQSTAGGSKSTTDQYVLLFTLLVCNCGAEVCLIIVHMAYGSARPSQTPVPTLLTLVVSGSFSSAPAAPRHTTPSPALACWSL